MERIGNRNLGYDFVTISLRFLIYDCVTNRYKFQSVSSDQISPLCSLYYYILRANLVG